MKIDSATFEPYICDFTQKVLGTFFLFFSNDEATTRRPQHGQEVPYAEALLQEHHSRPLAAPEEEGGPGNKRRIRQPGRLEDGKVAEQRQRKELPDATSAIFCFKKISLKPDLTT